MKFMILMQNVVQEDPDSAYISVSNSFDPDQARHIVGSDLGPNCLKCFQETALLEGRKIKPA